LWRRNKQWRRVLLQLWGRPALRSSSQSLGVNRCT
jgi:hypothetical protein